MARPTSTMIIEATQEELVARMMVAYLAEGVNPEDFPFPVFMRSVARRASGANLTPGKLAKICEREMVACFPARKYNTEWLSGIIPALRAVAPTGAFGEAAVAACAKHLLGDLNA